MKDDTKKVFIRSWGCQMNTRDSEVVLGLFVERGYLVAESADAADVILINTCSVREHAENRALSFLGSLKKIKRPMGPALPTGLLSGQTDRHSLRSIDRKTKMSMESSLSALDYPQHGKRVVGLIGCMAQNYRQEIFRRFPDVDFIAGPGEIGRIPEIVSLIRDGRRHLAALGLAGLRPEWIYSSRFHQDKRQAYVNISEGCDNFCSYCVVPYVRGRLRHRKPEDIIREINRLVSSGVKEITLLGQNVNSYRGQRTEDRGQEKEAKKIDFVGLLRKVNDVEGLESFSFVTSHPKDASEKLFLAMRDLPKLKKYLHLPVQSGSDRILKLMNRGYTARHYKSLVDAYREIVPGAEISTDIILGFPTETKKDFQATYDMLERLRFNSAYIFKYSPRPRTQAAEIPDDVSKSEKERRHRLLLDLQKKISRQIKKSVCIFFTVYCLLATVYSFCSAAGLEKAQELFLLSDYEGVIGECPQMIASSYNRAEKAELYYLSAQAHIKINNLSEAEDLFRKIIVGYKDSPVYERALLGLGDVYCLAEDYVQAKDVYLRVKESDSDSLAQAYYKLALVDFKLGNLKQGREYLAALKRKFPLSFEAGEADLLDIGGLFWTIQVGAFSSRENALALATDLRTKSFDSYIQSLTTNNKPLYRVRVGKFNSKQDAEETKQELSDQGFPTKIFP